MRSKPLQKALRKNFSVYLAKANVDASRYHQRSNLVNTIFLRKCAIILEIIVGIGGRGNSIALEMLFCYHVVRIGQTSKV